MSKIAEKFKIKTVSILYNNKAELDDNPHGLKPGMSLVIPPADGILYTWKDGDTLEKVAAEYNARVDDIVNYPGNDVDLTNPGFKPGTLVMIPGGSRELLDWTQFIPTITRGSGTGTSEIGGSGCSGGLGGRWRVRLADQWVTYHFRKQLHGRAPRHRYHRSRG